MADELNDCQGEGPEFVERAHRDKLKENIARALCPTDPDDLPRDAEGNVTANVPAWTYYVPEADAALSAIEASGYVLMPKDPTSEMIAKVHWLGETSVREVYAALMAGVKFKEASDG